MKTLLDLDYEGAMALRAFLETVHAPWMGGARVAQRVTMDALDNAIQNEDERRAERSQEMAFDRAESADIKYKESPSAPMKPVMSPPFCSCCGCLPRKNDKGHTNPLTGGFYCSDCSPIHDDPKQPGVLCKGCATQGEIQ